MCGRVCDHLQRAGGEAEADAGGRPGGDGGLALVCLALAGCAVEASLPSEATAARLAVRETDQALLREAVELQETRAALDMENRTSPARAQATAAILLAGAETATTRAGFRALMELAGCLTGCGLIGLAGMVAYAYFTARVEILKGRYGMESRAGRVEAIPPSRSVFIDWRMAQEQKDALRLLGRAIRLVGSEERAIPSDDVLRVSRHERDGVVGLLAQAGAVRVYPSKGTYVDDRWGTLGRLFEAVKEGWITLPYREEGRQDE